MIDIRVHEAVSYGVTNLKVLAFTLGLAAMMWPTLFPDCKSLVGLENHLWDEGHGSVAFETVGSSGLREFFVTGTFLVMIFCAHYIIRKLRPLSELSNDIGAFLRGEIPGGYVVDEESEEEEVETTEDEWGEVEKRPGIMSKKNVEQPQSLVCGKPKGSPKSGIAYPGSAPPMQTNIAQPTYHMATPSLPLVCYYNPRFCPFLDP